MDRRERSNLDILELAVDRLGPLVEQLVLLGGCAVELLLTDTAAPPVRATLDVDMIVEVGSLAEYYRLADRLRERGFSEDQSADAPVCRWVSPPVRLDVMPTQPNVLGFGNAWYSPALESARQVTLPSGKTVRLVTAAYFIATKFAAFESRGADDYVMSHDLEDIIAVVDGRQEIVTEVQAAEYALRSFLASRFRRLVNDPRFVEAIPGFLPGDSASQARLPMLMDRIRSIAALL